MQEVIHEIPHARCFKCKKSVKISQPELHETKPGNNKRPGKRFRGFCEECQTAVGVFVNKDLTVKPKEDKVRTPEEIALKIKEKECKKLRRKLKRKLEKDEYAAAHPEEAAAQKEKKKKEKDEKKDLATHVKDEKVDEKSQPTPAPKKRKLAPKKQE